MAKISEAPRLLIDGLALRCPRCHRGRTFATWTTMNTECSVCGLPFEKASGEITGGMGISIVLTLLVIIVVAFFGGLNPDVPLGPLIGGLAAFAILFPILFYRQSRSLWLSFLYFLGDHDEGD